MGVNQNISDTKESIDRVARESGAGKMVEDLAKKMKNGGASEQSKLNTQDRHVLKAKMHTRLQEMGYKVDATDSPSLVFFTDKPINEKSYKVPNPSNINLTHPYGTSFGDSGALHFLESSQKAPTSASSSDDRIIAKIISEHGSELKSLRCICMKAFHKPGYTVAVMKGWQEGGPGIGSIGSTPIYDIEFKQESSAKRLEAKLKTLFSQQTDYRSAQTTNSKNTSGTKEVVDRADNEVFNISTTGMAYYDGILTNPTYFVKSRGIIGEIKQMSPDEYLTLAAKAVNAPHNVFIATKDDTSIDMYSAQMKAGIKFDMVVLDYAGHAQEGRNRALAAKKLGIIKIPVFVVGLCGIKGR